MAEFSGQDVWSLVRALETTTLPAEKQRHPIGTWQKRRRRYRNGLRTSAVIACSPSVMSYVAEDIHISNISHTYLYPALQRVHLRVVFCSVVFSQQTRTPIVTQSPSLYVLPANRLKQCSVTQPHLICSIQLTQFPQLQLQPRPSLSISISILSSLIPRRSPTHTQQN